MGATDELLEKYHDELGALGLVLVLQPGEATLTLDELAEQSGLSLPDALNLRLAMGLPSPESSELIASEQDIKLYTTMRDVGDLFGWETIVRLARVIGTSAATVADAATSAFLINVDMPYRDELGQEHATSPDMLALTGDFVERLSYGSDVVLRHHLVRARRKNEVVVIDGFEISQSTIGFVDLVNSTGIAQDLEITELGRMLMTFEKTANSIVTQNGGRTVKLIGDEVMFSVEDPESAVRIGVEIAKAAFAHPDLPDVRVGIADGEVLARDGDFFGPTVNLAARLAGAAEPRTVLVAQPISDSLGSTLKVDKVVSLNLAGFSNPVQASLISGSL
jgi:adenylate cyclase